MREWNGQFGSPDSLRPEGAVVNLKTKICFPHSLLLNTNPGKTQMGLLEIAVPLLSTSSIRNLRRKKKATGKNLFVNYYWRITRKKRAGRTRMRRIFPPSSGFKWRGRLLAAEILESPWEKWIDKIAPFWIFKGPFIWLMVKDRQPPAKESRSN